MASKRDEVCRNHDAFRRRARTRVLEAMVGGILDVTCSDCGANHAKVDTLAPLTIKTSGSTTLVGSGIVDVDVTAAKLIACATAHWSRMQQVWHNLSCVVTRVYIAIPGSLRSATNFLCGCMGAQQAAYIVVNNVITGLKVLQGVCATVV